MIISKDLIKHAEQSSKDAILAMEKFEDWAIDDPDINKSIDIMLENFEEITRKKEIDKQSFVRFLTYLLTGNMMKILRTIEEKNPEFMEEFIDVVNSLNISGCSKFSLAISDRIMVLYRMFIIPQIFSKENILSVERGIELLKLEKEGEKK